MGNQVGKRKVIATKRIQEYVLYPRFEINKYIALFLAPLIKAAGKNYVYKDKWQIEDMKRSIIYLPVKCKEPDWEYMEKYMRALEVRATNMIDSMENSIERNSN